MSDFSCPQCGEGTDTLYEGFCEVCRDENQSRLNQHNAEYDYWNSLTNGEQDRQIKEALRGIIG